MYICKYYYTYISNPLLFKALNKKGRPFKGPTFENSITDLKEKGEI